MVFYRKYRPQTISELDSTSLRQTLTSVLSQKSVPHAFLFTGPKGLGKTSTARIVAKAINCTTKDKKSIEPCNTCDQCTSITNGSNMDVLEIDAASNRGIDEIRDLREKIRLAPLSAKKKVYIIDEVHMLTTEAFNALLKTLEEPPAHVIFVLCTTELHKVPATIMSRCFTIQFTLATAEELKSSFSRIVKSEKIDIEDNALDYIATLSDGSFRDGAKVLEEVSLLSGGKKITQQMVEEKFKISNLSTNVDAFFQALQQKNTKDALGVVDTLVKNGSDLRFFAEELLGKLHTQLLTVIQGEKGIGFGVEEIKILANLLGKAYGDMKYSPIAQLPLELAVVEYCGLEWGPVSSFPPVNARVDAVNSGSGTPLRVSGSLSSAATPSKEKSISLNKLLDELKKDRQHALAGLLRSCTIQSFDGKTVVFATKYKYHKERLEDTKVRPALLKAVHSVAGEDTGIEIVLQG